MKALICNRINGLVYICTARQTCYSMIYKSIILLCNVKKNCYFNHIKFVSSKVLRNIRWPGSINPKGALSLSEFCIIMWPHCTMIKYVSIVYHAQHSTSLLGDMRKRWSSPKNKFVYWQLLSICQHQMSKACNTRFSLANKQANK